MSKYILFQNDGEIENNSFELIGASTKRDSKTAIGFFGSGLKYSIAYMFRNNINFKIFSGENQLLFTTEKAKIKDTEFERICINDRPTSYTTTMGPTWNEDWMVVREIWCNCLDESNAQLIKDIENPIGVEGKTRIYIELSDKFQTILENWDEYFSDDREQLYTIENVDTYGLGKEKIQDIKVFQKTKGILYRKNIQVSTNTKYMYDYGCTDIDVNEDRKASRSFYLEYAFTNIFAGFCYEEYICSVLRNHKCLEYTSLEGTSPTTKVSNKWINFSKNYCLVVSEKSGKYVDQLMKETREVFLIPQHFAKILKEQMPNVEILGMSKSLNGNSFELLEITPKETFLLKEVTTSLKEMQYEIFFDINIVEFQDVTTLGQADMKEKQIYLSRNTFNLGRKEIALTIMEEQEHILSQKKDETRAFQTHIFTKWLTSMENNSSLFL